MGTDDVFTVSKPEILRQYIETYVEQEEEESKQYFIFALPVVTDEEGLALVAERVDQPGRYLLTAYRVSVITMDDVAVGANGQFKQSWITKSFPYFPREFGDEVANIIKAVLGSGHVLGVIVKVREIGGRAMGRIAALVNGGYTVIVEDSDDPLYIAFMERGEAVVGAPKARVEEAGKGLVEVVVIK